MWIDGDEWGCDVAVGERYFLIETTHYNHGSMTTYALSDRPAYTNQTGEPRLHGWCGTTDNRSVSAEGMVEVVCIAKNGRIKIRQIAPTLEVLEKFGHPELAES